MDELIRILSIVAQLEEIAMRQYNQYKTEQGLTDEQMKAHLLSMNAEDDIKLAAVIARATEQGG